MHAITLMFRRVLVALADQPLTSNGVSKVLSISMTTAKRHLRDGLDKGYMTKSKTYYDLTEKGKEAIVSAPVVTEASHVHAYSLAKAAKLKAVEYVEYVPAPYNHNDFRPGSMDAYKLPSRTMAGREWP